MLVDLIEMIVGTHIASKKEQVDKKHTKLYIIINV